MMLLTFNSWTNADAGLFSDAYLFAKLLSWLQSLEEESLPFVALSLSLAR